MAGRPTKLTKELVEKAKTYLSTCEDTVLETEKGGISYVNVKLPMVADLALYLGISKSTVYDWCQEREDIEDNLAQEFSDIVKEINQEQEKRLINKGLGGLYAPKIAGMIMSKHGYSEKQEIDHTTKGEKITDDTKIYELTNILNDLHKRGSIKGHGESSNPMDTKTSD
jgi:DNA-binding transcriptional regulator YiaG